MTATFPLHAKLQNLGFTADAVAAATITPTATITDLAGDLIVRRASFDVPIVAGEFTKALPALDPTVLPYDPANPTVPQFGYDIWIDYKQWHVPAQPAGTTPVELAGFPLDGEAGDYSLDALASEAGRAMAAETALRTGTDGVFEARQAAAYAPGGTAGNLGTTQGDARYVPNAGAVEGVPAQVYGDSFAASDFSSTGPATRWTARAMRRLGFGSMVNLAAAGAWMQDAASRATGTPPSTLPANSTGVILLHSVLNDVLNATPTATKRLNGFKNALLAFLLLARASTRIESSDASFVYSGTWGTNTIGDSSGGSIRQTSTGGSCTITTPACTDLSIGLFAVDPGAGGATGSCTITIDGGAPVTVDLSNACGTTGSGDVARTWTPIQVPFYGLANVAHTVVVTDTSTGGKSTYLDNLLVLRKASKSPQVVLFKGEYCTAVGYANYGVTPNPTNATVDTYNALIDTVLAGLDSTANITALDPNAAGWNPATMTGAQTSSFTAVHPNDLGEAFLGDLVTRSLAALPYRQGLNV